MEICGERLVLRAWREEDASAVCEACQGAEIQRWLPLIPRPYTVEHARTFAAALPEEGQYPLAVEEDGRLVGAIELRVDAQAGSGSIGYGQRSGATRCSARCFPGSSLNRPLRRRAG
jgi:RimJ/RimL family protein N-acetyltransferase